MFDHNRNSVRGLTSRRNPRRNAAAGPPVRGSAGPRQGNRLSLPPSSETRPMALKEPATTLGTLGNYDLLDKLGEGSMGTVYKACHWTTREVVAIKVMPSNIARKPMLLKRFEQEFRIASRVDHPNVVRVLEYNGQGVEPYLVMEFVDGVSLGDRLERERRLSEREATRLIVQ